MVVRRLVLPGDNGPSLHAARCGRHDGICLGFRGQFSTVSDVLSFAGGV